MFEKKERTSGQKKRQDKKRNGSRQTNKRGDSKVELNDSLEIPDSADTSDTPGLPNWREDLEKTLNELGR